MYPVYGKSYCLLDHCTGYVGQLTAWAPDMMQRSGLNAMQCRQNPEEEVQTCIPSAQIPPQTIALASTTVQDSWS